MPYLGDYLGQLLSEITVARMKADLETVRVAELYASHPLLKHMPVPHFRMPDVNMDVPIVIKQMEEAEEGESPHGTPPLPELRKAFDKVLTRELGRENIRVKAEHKVKIKSALDEKTEDLKQPGETAVDVHYAADEMTDMAIKKLSELKYSEGTDGAERLGKLEDSLKKAARMEFIKLKKPPKRLQALVTTSEIREAGPGENITRLRLKISEEAVEWTTIESEGLKKNRLVPE